MSSSSAERAKERRRDRDVERRAAESPGDRERRLERERGRSFGYRDQLCPQGPERGDLSAIEKGEQRSPQGVPRGLRCSPSLRRIGHGYFGTLAAHNSCTHAQPRPGSHTEAPRSPPTGSKVLPVEEGSGAWGPGRARAAVAPRIRDREGPGPAAAGL